MSKPSPRGRPRKTAAPTLRRAPKGAAIAIVDAVIAAAESVLAAEGLAGLTTNRIAETAGVSIGSLYQYFPNRNAIVAALCDKYIARYAAILPHVLHSHAGLPLPELATKIADAYVDEYLSQPRVHRWLWHLRSESQTQEKIDRQMDEMVATVATFIAARGSSPTRESLSLDAKTLAFVLVHAIDGAANAVANRSPEIDARAAGRALAALVTAYFTHVADR